jgi:hypothetical protein
MSRSVVFARWTRLDCERLDATVKAEGKGAEQGTTAEATKAIAVKNSAVFPEFHTRNSTNVSRGILLRLAVLTGQDKTCQNTHKLGLTPS